jgi:hypothetical protein
MTFRAALMRHRRALSTVEDQQRKIHHEPGNTRSSARSRRHEFPRPPRDEEEVDAAVRVLRSRSPFRYYGIDVQKEVETFETEFAVMEQVRACRGSGTASHGAVCARRGARPGGDRPLTLGV